MLAAAIATAVATAILALFTGAAWKLAAIQHKLYHDAELAIHPWPEVKIAERAASLINLGYASSAEEELAGAKYVEYQIALVNRGSVPIIVTEVKEEGVTAESGRVALTMQFSRRPQHSGGLLISEIPWFIPGRDFAICSRWLSFSGDYQRLRKKDFNVYLTLRYHNGQRRRTVTHNPPLRWGYDEDYPGQQATRSGPVG